ncbi:TPA: DNA-binding protein [Burkholderia cepacia]|uniref:DNA-binding protein n=1 Tax=Burkholderia cepacia TaxID=292 RepID=UPI001CF3C89F|nr:DNA-binding protein [Burkholderia cepacia]MCA8359386.1 DNA-binding protein [Burkholderia cepacia]HDR9763448.1 DNA-binding protein [Burkholderia cepacia ATCC 25416]HDV6366378.1 DNA-binding protein [Burkholderia cepacia]
MKNEQAAADIRMALQAYGVTGTVPTAVAAVALNRKEQTLRKWACEESGPIRPVRINRRLAWKIADIQALLDGSMQ